MKSFYWLAMALVILGLSGAVLSAAADKLIISHSSRELSLPAGSGGGGKRLFQGRKPEPLLIQMRSQATVPALISSEVHYTLSFGNIVAGAVWGMLFKILAVLTDKPLHSMVSRPEIKTIDELCGKRIGSQRRHKPIPLSQARD